MNHLGPEECSLCWRFDCRCWAASAIEALSGVETAQTGSTEGESAVAKPDAQTPTSQRTNL